MTQAEAVDITVAMAEKRAFYYPGSFSAEGVRRGDLAGQAGLNRQLVEVGGGVDIVPGFVESFRCGVEQEVAFPCSDGLATIDEVIGFDKSAERNSVILSPDRATDKQQSC